MEIIEREKQREKKRIKDELFFVLFFSFSFSSFKFSRDLSQKFLTEFATIGWQQRYIRSSHRNVIEHKTL